MQDDEGDPDDAGRVHGKADELRLVEVLRQVARLKSVQRAHGDQQQIQTERYEHSHVRVLATRQLSHVHCGMHLRRVSHRVDDRRYRHHCNLGRYDDSCYDDLQQQRIHCSHIRYTMRPSSMLNVLASQ